VSHERLRALTNDALLHRNVLINMAALALPAITALVSIPLLGRGLAPAQFGLLTFAWAVAGLFSIIDFGLARALTRLVAVRLARGQDQDVADLVWAASWIQWGLTVPIGLIGWFMSPFIVEHLMKVPPAFHAEAVGVLRMLSIALAPMAHGPTLRGVLEAAQQFSVSARLRIPAGVIVYGGPLLALPLGGDARIAVGAIVAGRVLYWLAHFFVLGHIVPGIARPRYPNWGAARELAGVGRWIFVSNFIGPLLSNADRLFMAAAFPIAASGWYGTSAELATKQFLFTGAMNPVLFPALAASYDPDPERAVALVWKATWVTLVVVFASSLVLAGLAHPLLRVWMRGAYSPVAAEVLPWLAIGVFINCVAQVPFAMLQGAVDTRGPALLYIIEVPIYAGMLVLFAHWWGVPGVALAWLGRMVLDAAGQWAFLAAGFPAARRVVLRTTWLTAAALTVLVAAGVAGAGWR
jgi:O-antigen/teichoic acid export membrane protein